MIYAEWGDAAVDRAVGRGHLGLQFRDNAIQSGATLGRVEQRARNLLYLYISSPLHPQTQAHRAPHMTRATGYAEWGDAALDRAVRRGQVSGGGRLACLGFPFKTLCTSVL